jgi:hypothetical protein
MCAAPIFTATINDTKKIDAAIASTIQPAFYSAAYFKKCHVTYEDIEQLEDKP